MPVTVERMTPKRIEIDATRSEISQLAAYLQEHLGQRVAAYLSGLKDPKMVGQWAKGKVQPRDAASLRLRHGYRAARLIAEAFGDETAKAWLFGSNSQLSGEAPAAVLRHARLPEEVTPVVLAASGFVESGHGTTLAAEPEDYRREMAHFLTRLLTTEVHVHPVGRPYDSEREIAKEIKQRLLDSPESAAERIRTLDLAHDEVAERLGEVVASLKSHLVERSKEADS